MLCVLLISILYGGLEINARCPFADLLGGDVPTNHPPVRRSLRVQETQALPGVEEEEKRFLRVQATKEGVGEAERRLASLSEDMLQCSKTAVRELWLCVGIYTDVLLFGLFHI